MQEKVRERGETVRGREREREKQERVKARDYKQKERYGENQRKVQEDRRLRGNADKNVVDRDVEKEPKCARDREKSWSVHGRTHLGQ